MENDIDILHYEHTICKNTIKNLNTQNLMCKMFNEGLDEACIF